MSLGMLCLLLSFALAKRYFKVEGDNFVMDGKPFYFVSGSFHYFRVHESSWENTIKKMVNGGLNAIQTYVAWNLHEPYKGVYYWEGRCDIVRWLELCQKYDMYVIFRPGPYICAEWEYGGFPWWFNKVPHVPIRGHDPVYIQHIRDFWSVLFAKVKKFTYANGGNIIMTQIENEFGNWRTCDKVYLKHLADIIHEYLGEMQLFTTDLPELKRQKCGSLKEEAYAIVDYAAGWDPTNFYRMEREYNGGGPYVATEVWPGWFDDWGGKHHTRSTSAVVFSLEKTLQLNGSLNFYMYIGGTNFGFTSGGGGMITTSYDYDAQLSEAGDMTWKYQQTLATIKKYRPTRTVAVENSTKKSYGTIQFTEGCTVSEGLEVLTHNSTQYETPIAMEELNVGYGFALYRTKTNGGKLHCPVIADRASIIVDGKRIAIQTFKKEAEVDIPAGELDILVENPGRTNSGYDHIKGLTKTPTLNGAEIKGWTSIGLDTNKVEKLPWKTELPERIPGFYRGTFNVDEIADTFLNPKGWTRGVVWINGFNIGKYWTIGPQLTLYVPAGLLKHGQNEVIVFESEHLDKVSGKMTLDDVHQIDIKA
jgi:beta-galactosidase